MNILSDYIRRTVFLVAFVTSLVFSGLILFVSFFDEITRVGRGEYGAWQAFIYLLLQLPSQFYLLFPMIGLIASLLGLGFLSAHQELTVMRAAGVSMFKIIRVVFSAMIIIIVIVTIMGEVFAPYLNSVAENYKRSAENNGQVLAIGNSIWLKEKNNFIYINQTNSKNELNGVTLYEFNDQHQLVKNVYAKSASYVHDQWILNHVSESDISTKGVKVKFYRRLPSDMSLTPEVFHLALLDPTDMNLVDLWRFIQSRQAEGLKVTSYQINFWQRIYAPLAMTIMMFLALPFVFGSSRGLTIGFRIFIGIVFGYAFVMLSDIVAQVGLLVSLPPPILTLLPLLVFGVFGIILTRWFIR